MKKKSPLPFPPERENKNTLPPYVKRALEEKGLSAGERKMYQTARQVLVAELSISTKIENDVLMSLVGAE